MPDLVTRLKLDNSQYNSGIDSAKQKTKEFQDTADDASKSINDLGSKGAKSASELLKEMGKMENAGRSASNFRRQLGEIQKQIVDLTVGYRNMTSEMQNSPLGQEVAAKIQELTDKAAQYKDAILDASASVKTLASDTAAWDSIKMGIDTASAALQGFVSMGVLGEKSTEKLVSVIAKLKSIEAGTNAVIKIGNALQKQSALMMGIAKIQAAALAKAKQLEAVATGKATVAQKLFNAVAKANPYVLLAAAVIAVGTALYAFTKKAKDAGDAAKSAAKSMEAYNKQMKIAQGEAGSTIAKFKILETQYKSLRTEGDKQQWIKDNADKFKELGMKIDDVNDADDTFIKNSDKVIRAMVLRAQATAALSVYEEEYAKAYKKSLEMQDKKANKNPNWLSRKDIEGAGLIQGEDYKAYTTPGSPTIGQGPQTYWELTESGRKKMADYGKKDAEAYRAGVEEGLAPIIADVTAWTAEADKLESEVAGYRKARAEETNKSGGSGGTKANKEVEQALVNQLDILKKQKQELEEQKKYIEYGSDEWYAQLKAINDIDNQIKKLEEEEKGYIALLNRAPLEKLEPVKLKFELPNKIELPPQKLEVDLTPKGDKMKKIFDEAKAQAQKIQDWFDVGAISAEMAKQMIQGLNDELERQGIKARVDIEIPDEAVQKIDTLVGKMDKFGSMSSGVYAINDIYESLSGLTDKLDEAANGWEQFFAVFQAGMTVFQSVTTIIETIGTVMEALNAAKATNIGLTQQEATATMQEASAHGANAGAAISEAAAEGAAAGAKGASSVASIPYVGPILAVAAIASIMAAIIAMISQAKGFANGGIVKADSKFGDKNLIRVNDGEMVLNTKQQANLFKMLNEGKQDNAQTGGQVEFKINGTQLVGVLNNINKKNAKI